MDAPSAARTPDGTRKRDEMVQAGACMRVAVDMVMHKQADVNMEVDLAIPAQS